MTSALAAGAALLAAPLFAAAALACSGGSGDDAPQDAPAAAQEPAATPTAAPRAAVAEVDENTRGGATGPGEFGEYLVAQTYRLDMTVSSTEFDHRRRIPREYSCSEDDISAPITWSAAPEGTVSIAVVMESDQNPGAPWSHLVMWNIPADAAGLPADIARTHEAAAVGPAARQGTNDDGNVGWNGPCPPEVRHVWSGGGALENPVKKYTFRVFALDSEISLGVEATKDDLLKAIDGHVIAAGELNGKYAQRRKF